MLIFYFTIVLTLSLITYFIKNKFINILSTLTFIILQVFITYFAYVSINQFDSIFFRFDSLGVLFTGILSMLTVSTFFYSRYYLAQHSNSYKNERIYYALLMLLIASMTGVFLADNLAVLWICIEATTLFVSGLIYHDRSKTALEASWKYLFISSIGIAIAFIGIIFLNISTNKTSFNGLSYESLILTSQSIDTVWLKVTFVLVLTGFSAKMGIFPLYSVTVDAHTAAPPPISAFISTTLMNAGFFGIFRLFAIISQTDSFKWAKHVLLIAGVISVFFSAIHLLKIKHFKRMYAFSSLEHMGIVSIGMAIGGIGYYAAILHLILHSFVKSAMFYQIDLINKTFGSYWIKDSGGYLKISSLGGILILLSLLLITAIPPSGMFVSEFMIYKALFLKHNYFIATITLIMLSIIIFVISKNILHLLFAPKPDSTIEKDDKIIFQYIPILFLLAVSVYIGYNPPGFLVELINSSISILK